MVIGMGASAGRGRRACIENDLTICTIKNRARFSTISGQVVEAEGGMAETVVGGVEHGLGSGKIV